jgi:nucleotide-binding universal stress UspA family protein
MTWFSKNKKKVIVPVDFTDESFAAVDVGLQIVNAPADLTVVHVLPDLSPAEPGEMWGTIDKETRIGNAKQALRERLGDDTSKDIQIDISIGDAGHEIAKLAERQGAELIVLPSHGRTGIKRLLIGSVAERVVRLAHCPVLVLRS